MPRPHSQIRRGITKLVIAMLCAGTITTSAHALPSISLSTPIGIRGLFIVNQTLQIVAPSDSGVSYVYKWYADGSLLGSETNSSLVLSSSHNGKAITAAVVASKSGSANTTFNAVLGATVITSAFTSNSSTTIDGVRVYEPYCANPTPQSTPQPYIGWNVAMSCQTLNTSLGTPTSRVFQWYRASTAITDATSNAYNLKSSDSGMIISASHKSLYSNNAVYLDFKTYSAAIAPEVTAAKPVISGTVSNGSTLTATTVGFDGAATLTYQWFRDYFPISSATNRTYQVTNSDLHKALHVLVTATRDGYVTSSQVSDPVSNTAITDPTSAIYSSISNFTRSSFDPDITYVVSPNVNGSLLNIRKAELEIAADFWHNDYVPVGNVAMYLTENDATWANNWMRTNHPTWSSDAGWWITTYDCGYAFAVRFSNDYFFEQCLKSTATNTSDWQQVTPHEYTHWVQYAQTDGSINTPTTPWLVEGQANFYGLALGIAAEDPQHSTIDLSLARQAESFSSYFQQPFGTQVALQMMIDGNITDIQTLYSRSGTAGHSYVVGTLMSEWLIYKFGHATYWNWVKGILSGKNATVDNGAALTATLTQTYFGMSFTDLARNAIPYLSMRAKQLNARWQLEINPPSQPDPPSITSAVPGNGQVTLSWDAGFAHNSTISGYKVEWSGGTQECSTSPCVITGLTNGVYYGFIVTAHSNAGDSSPSGESNIVTPFTVPDAPTAVEASAGDGQAIVSWNNSTPRGSAVTGYRVIWSSGSKECSSSPCMITGLSNGTAYSFTVLAHSDAGDSSLSDSSNSVTPDSGIQPISAPTNVFAVRGNGTATVTWDAPSVGEENVVGYLVSYNGGFQSCDESPCLITELTNGVSYRFTVVASTLDSESDSSLPSNSVTPAGKPSGPTALIAKATKAGASSLSWSGVKTNGSRITKYEVSWKLSTVKTYGAWKSTGTRALYAVSGWKKGKAYHVRVRVTNALGQTISKTFTVKQSK